MYQKFITHSNSKPSGLLARIFKTIVALILISLVVILATVLFVYLAIAALLIFGYWRWKTRNLRKNMPEQTRQKDTTQEGEIIEGEVIRRSE
ncbi:MAG: hypothetical protein WC742_01465 [Gallionellaceae bacterium]|jgi:predicted membrane protein